MYKPTVSVIIPTRGNSLIFQALIESILIQSYPVQEILLIVDHGTDRTLIDTYISSQSSLSPLVSCLEVPKAWGGVSSARNYGVQQAQWDMVLLGDDDIVLKKDTIEQFVHHYALLEKKYKKPLLLYPYLVYGQTKELQSLWFLQYHFRCGWPEPVVVGNWKQKVWRSGWAFFKWIASFLAMTPPSGTMPRNDIWYIKTEMFWSQCLFGQKETFLNYPYDERMPFVYEDLDMTMRMTRAGVMLFAVLDIVVDHFEAHRTSLQKSYIASPSNVYQKMRNRILFVRKNWTWREKIQFFWLGLWFGFVWFAVNIIAMSNKKRESLYSLCRGLVSWCMS